MTYNRDFSPEFVLIEDILRTAGQPITLDAIVFEIQHRGHDLRSERNSRELLQWILMQARKSGNGFPIVMAAKGIYGLREWNDLGEVSSFSVPVGEIMSTENKFCQHCGKILPPENFQPATKNGIITLGSWCRSCCNEETRQFRLNPENAEKIRERDRIHYEKKDREKEQERLRKHYAENKERIYDRVAKFREDNREKVLEYQRKTNQRRRAMPRNRIDSSMTRDVGRSLKQGRKNGETWEKLVGYTIADLVVHLESRFTEEMIWDNYGRDGWHLDHVRPLASFHYENETDPEFLEAWSLDNLQPLMGRDNESKGSLYEGKRHYYPKTPKKNA